MNFKLPAIIIFIAVYLYQLLLSVITMRSAKNPVPANVADVYDAETYRKWRAYHAEKTRFGIVTSTVSFVVDLVLLAFNVYAAFASLFPRTDFMQLFAVVLLSALTSLVMIPFSWHRIMVIEEKYGYNKSTSKTFAADQVKEFVIGLVLSTGVAALLMGVHHALGDWLILAFAVLMTLILLGITFL